MQAYNSQLPEYSGIADAAESYYDESRKPVLEIIDRNISYFKDLYDVITIFVRRFSFCKADISNQKKIIDANNYPEQVKWYLSYYSDEWRGKFANILSGIGIYR